MSKNRLELKVGLFVFFCLVILAALLLQFSKGATFLQGSTYTVILEAANVGGLRPEAGVLMSGVKVGAVSKTVLSPQGTNVSIYLKIHSQFVLHDDALFVIEQSGFLGDQYVAIYPGLNQGQLMTNGSVAHVEPPFNLQEAARSANGFIKRLDGTAKKLDAAIDDVRRLVLNEKTLTNIAFTISTLKQVSDDALVTVDNVNLLIKTNGAPIDLAISNLVIFSSQLDSVAQSAQAIVNTNGPQIAAAISNIQTSTAILTNLLSDVQAGKGLAGGLLRNQVIADNVAELTRNLAITSSNLNRLGLWHFIWYHPKVAETNAPSAKHPVYASPSHQSD
jgi:phospholipid/cholesterol/gamma-HCH transport system substrate-binding protein